MSIVKTCQTALQPPCREILQQTRHTMYCTSFTPSPLPCSLQDMASRWGSELVHWMVSPSTVCLVFTIEICGMTILQCGHFLLLCCPAKNFASSLDEVSGLEKASSIYSNSAKMQNFQMILKGQNFVKVVFQLFAFSRF